MTNPLVLISLLVSEMRRTKLLLLTTVILTVLLSVNITLKSITVTKPSKPFPIATHWSTQIPNWPKFSHKKDRKASDSSDETEFTCWRDFAHPNYRHESYEVEIPIFCRPTCIKPHTFSLPGMSKCRPWLTCDDLKDISNNRSMEIKRGPGVKDVRLALWQNEWTVVVTTPQRVRFTWLMEILLDFYITVSSTYKPEITQFLGNCTTMAFFEFSPLGSLNQLDKTMMSSRALRSYNSFQTRFRLCFHLAHCFQFLLHSEFGPRVLGDIDVFEKALSQFLVTNDLKVIINDYDVIPLNGSELTCNPANDYSQDSYFIAPEANCETLLKANHNKTVSAYVYHESNIWKLPDMFRFILKDFGNQLPRRKRGILKELELLYQLCKIRDWRMRASADKVITILKRMAEKFDISLSRPTPVSKDKLTQS